MIRRNGHLPRNVHRLTGVAAAVLASAAAFVATTTTAAAATSKPKPGGNLTFLIQQFPAGWESSLSSISSYEGNFWGEITVKLVYVADSGQVSPWIATSWKQEDAARKFILNLKHGVTFSDGEPLNAQAVVDNINIWAKGDPTRGALIIRRCTPPDFVDSSQPTLPGGVSRACFCQRCSLFFSPI